jgi:hypothetical protein
MQGTAANGMIEAKVNDDGYKDLGDWLAYMYCNITCRPATWTTGFILRHMPIQNEEPPAIRGRRRRTIWFVPVVKVDGEHGDVGVRCGILPCLCGDDAGG